MKKYALKLELQSPTLAGSGAGFGAEINTDIVFDEIGIPFIPAKRIKGCLLDAAKEVEEMFRRAEIKTDDLLIEKVFGKTGYKESAPVYFSNLFIEDYAQNKSWLDYFSKLEEYKHIIKRERILEVFTEIRQQTEIDSDTGVASEHSLRTIRVLRKGATFLGDLQVNEQNEKIVNTLLLACLNFRRFGTKRNRGFGEVRCSLCFEGKELSITQTLEALCTP